MDNKLIPVFEYWARCMDTRQLLSFQSKFKLCYGCQTKIVLILHYNYS